jgi:alkylation response protein AidB-like acyl-CoA dehydrogenase
MRTLDHTRVTIAAQALCIAQGALDAALDYVKERRQFGKPIAEFQGIQFDLARMATELEAARLLTYNAARLRDAGMPFLTEAAMAKYYSSEIAETVRQGRVWRVGLRRTARRAFYRDAKIGHIYEGTQYATDHRPSNPQETFVAAGSSHKRRGMCAY